MQETKDNANIVSISKKLMIDHIYIFGANYNNYPNQIIDHPHLLCAYPSTGDTKSSKELEQISTFCFPNGFSKLNDISTEQIINDQFVFYIKHSTKNLFSTCVQFTVPNNSTAFFANKQNRCYPFAICIISKHACISYQIQFLTHLIYFLLGKEHPQKRLHKIPLLSNIRGLCHPSLIFDKRYMSVAVCEGMQVPRIFIEQMCIFQEEINDHETITPSRQLLHQTLSTLLSFVSIPNIIKLYTAVLLEKRILFVSKSASKYSSAVIALNSLTNMFCASTIIMPVVPIEYNVLLENPITYIAGSSMSNNNADIIYNLDTEEIYEDTEIPRLPSSIKLRNKLETFFEYQKDNLIIPDKNIRSFLFGDTISPEFIEYIKNLGNDALPICKISELKIAPTCELTDLIQNIFEEHISIRVIDFINSYKQMELFKEGMRSKSETVFYNEFISTQGGSMLVEETPPKFI